MSKRDGKRYEEIVADIYSQFSKDSVVKKNEFIKGNDGIDRQIDVSIRSNVIGYEMLVIVECKNYSKPVGISKVDELIGKKQDVNAHGAILVSDSGFTEGALKRAQKDFSIQLCSVLDSNNIFIRCKLQMPLAVTFAKLLNYTPCFQFVRTMRALSKGKKQFNPKDPNDVKELVDIAAPHIEACLADFYERSKIEVGNIPHGNHVYSRLILSNEDHQLIFKCSFEKSHRSFVNDNIFTPSIGIFDYEKEQLIQGKIEPIVLKESDIIANWTEVTQEHPLLVTSSHFRRIDYFSTSDLQKKSTEFLACLKQGQLIDLSQPNPIP